MSLNTSPSLLDAPQIVKRVFDGSNDSIRVNLGDVNGLTVSLSAVSGDSVITYDRSSPQKASITNANTGTILGPFDIKGMPCLNIWSNTTSTIVGSQACTLQISPSDTDNVWISTSITVTPSTVNGTAVAGTAILNGVGRRAQIIIAAAITSGTFDIYAVAQGS